MSTSKTGSTITAIICTVLFSSTVVLSAVGPAEAAGSAQAPTPAVRSLA